MKDVSNTELAILTILWEHAPLTVREIVELLYQEHRQSLHTSVKSLLQRLIQKSYVTVDKRTPVHQFTALVDRDSFVGHQVEKLADQVFAGDVAPILQTLIERVNISAKDRAAIEKLLKKLK